MTPYSDLQQRLRRYLLGQIDEDTRSQIEKSLLVDDDVFEELQVTEDEIIDEYIDGKMPSGDRIAFEQHFLSTPQRYEQLKFGRAFGRYLSAQTPQTPPLPISQAQPAGWWTSTLTFFSSPWRAAAFAAVVVVIGFGLWRLVSYESPADKSLIALNAAFREQRPLESRVSGFDYAPYVVTRGPGDERFDKNELQRAELMLLDELKRNPTPAIHHALGRVFLAKKEFDRAIEEFEEALNGSPNNARLHSDLGAAWFEKGKVDRFKAQSNPSGPEAGKATENFIRSVEELKQARKLDPNLTEAYFNSALAHEELVLFLEAEEDWKQYLSRDANSKWAQEAQQHLEVLDQQKKPRSKDKSRLVPEFVAAYASRNESIANELLSANTDAIAGQLMWWELAGSLMNSWSKSTDAVPYDQVLAYAGSVQAKKTGDRFLPELAAYYERTTPLQRAELARAHALINDGHALLTKSKVAEALDSYTQAKLIFDKTGDAEESMFADYWIGYSTYRQSKLKEGEAILTELAQRCRVSHYLSLLEKALTMIANIQAESTEYSKSIASYTQSLAISRKTGDFYNLQKNLSSLANGYRNLGNRSQSMAYLELCLESSKTDWPGTRQMYRNYYTTAAVLNTFSHYAAAFEYERAALDLAIEEADPILQNQSYVAMAAICSKLREYPEALKYATLGHETAAKMNEQARLRPAADAALQLAHVHRQTGDYANALGYYDEAIKSYEVIQHFALLYEAHKGKLLDYIAAHRDAEAKQELPLVLSLFEGHRRKIREESSRNSFFDMQQSVYDIAIDFEYSRDRNNQQAFEYSEQSRARSLLDLINATVKTTSKENPDLVISRVQKPLDLNEIQQRVPEQTQILQYTLLEDKVLIWVLSKDRFETAEQRIDSAALTKKVIHYSESLSSSSGSDTVEARRAGMELYDILIKPVESLLEKDKEIYIVPDKILNSLAFNALIAPANGRYLVNDYLLSFAPSSNVFVVCSEIARQRSERSDERLLSVGAPYFNANEFPELPELPASEKEATQIARYYKSADVLVRDRATKAAVVARMNSADVIHLASHYIVNDQNPLLSKLLLTPERNSKDESTGALQAAEICETKLTKTRLVTLSACRTGVERYYNGEGMTGMSRTFLMAGVPAVVASLWPVASDPTADLMIELHKYRTRKGLPTAQALRQAQLDMIANHDQPYYWAPFVFIGGYTSF